MIKFPDLPKWPQLVVSGLPLTASQTCEVMIRTTDFYLSSNDRDFEDKIYATIDRVLSYSFNSGDRHTDRGSRIKAMDKDLSVLTLDYLTNSRLVSCWVGGPKGWLNWDGRVGCCNYNIGKWPDAERVLEEWEAIARAFPYIELSCQLMSGESCEPDAAPLINYQVKEGLVTTTIPKERLESSVPFVDPSDFFFGTMCSVKEQRGCTIEQFEAVLISCRDRSKSK